MNKSLTAKLAVLVILCGGVAIAATAGKQPRDMKLLLLGVDGTEPSFQAARSFLDYMGTPYDAVLTKSQPLPALSDASKGFYQGIVLSLGNLSYCDAAGCRSALDENGWSAVEAYMREYSVRLAAFSAWPEKRYGLAPGNSLDTTATPANASFPSAAAAVFPYLNRTNPLKIGGVFVYLASPAPDPGETTTPLLTIDGATVAATHAKADGREYMALTFDQLPYLVHSLALHYGVFNWVTKGVFVGGRRIYLSPQNDDVFLSNTLFVNSVAACTPAGDPNPRAARGDLCPTVRMSNADLDNIRQWQDNLNAQSQFRQFRLTMAFNGYGSAYGDQPDVSPSDGLTFKAAELKSKFNWVSHTYDHKDLDCFVTTPGVPCAPADYTQSYTEIDKNLAVAGKLGLPLDSSSMVTPAITGLNNANFLAAARSLGIRYLVSDTSKAGGEPSTPNTGIRSPIEPSILLIPRRPMNVFVTTYAGGAGVAGSLPDQYNYFYGPNGTFRVGGPGGPPFFTTAQSYDAIIERESDSLLTYMLRGEIYPTMWHQSNFVRYSGNRTLFTDVAGAALAKYSKISALPVISLQQSEIGKALEERMTYLSAGVKATLTPGSGITLTSASSATVPVTGVCQAACESYGGQNQSRVAVNGVGAVQIPLN